MRRVKSIDRFRNAILTRGLTRSATVVGMHPIFRIVLCCGLLQPHAASAQRADSAAKARQLIRVAAQALVAGDTVMAADSALAAARNWPRQGAYLVTASRLASSLGRSATADSLLATLNQMGYGWWTDHPSFASRQADPAFQELASAARRNQAPLVRSTVFRELDDPGLHPEGVAIDPATGRVFVSSVRQQRVVEIAADGGVRDFLPNSVGLDAVLGLAVDSARRLLWVTTGEVPEQQREPLGLPGSTALLAVGLDDAAVTARWTIPDTTAAHLLGDVVMGRDGRAYATDSRLPGIYRTGTEAGGGVLERLPWWSDDWRSLQGLAFSGDGARAWVADWTTGLYRIDTATGAVTPVGGAPSFYTLGVDGLYWAGPGRLIGLQNGIAPPRVVEFVLDAAGDVVTDLRVLDRHLPLATEPTLGALVGNHLIYVANSPWALYGEDGEPDPASPWPRPVLLRLRVD